jgi:pyrroline-5-carboxylate reductase
MDTSLQLSTATARAIAASTFASFNTMDLEVEPSTSSQTSKNIASKAVTISTVGSAERRGRGRPPKYGIYYLIFS